jgi:hypothetical protein
MIDYIAVISQTGFPIAMCIYFVVRFEKVLNNNTTAIKEILKQIKREK